MCVPLSLIPGLDLAACKDTPSSRISAITSITRNGSYQADRAQVGWWQGPSQAARLRGPLQDTLITHISVITLIVRNGSYQADRAQVI